MSTRSLGGLLGPATVVAVLATAATTVPLAPAALGAPAAPGPIRARLAVGSGTLSVSAPETRVSEAGPLHVPLTIADARGTGAGWTLRLVTSEPVTVTSVSVACGPRSTCTLPRAVTVASGDVVLRAARGSGMGVMRVVVTIAPAGAGTSTRVAFTLS